jgi:Family of unknown function (DUF6518)
MSRGRTFGLFLLAGIAFGVFVAVLKGQDTGVRDALGNTSAPWVVVPFLAGTRYPRVWKAALVGIATTLASLLAFYAAEAAILDLGPHPWYTDLRLTLGSGRLYETWGLFSGALYGALGGMWASRRPLVAPVAVGLAFVCEPLIVLFVWKAGFWGGDLLFHYPWMWIGEVLIGLGAIAFVLAKAQSDPGQTRGVG